MQKKCQSENKSSSAKKTHKKDKKFYYDRLVKYCSDRGGKVLETKWTKAKDAYHFKCGNPDHPVFLRQQTLFIAAIIGVLIAQVVQEIFKKRLNKFVKKRWRAFR